ncbi:hypothetical protein B5M47_02235 [candidate division CPR3 bacterium 4484_211]|uniref:Response regulatory domain-containing protein n=1 Tax=candidate division CPR3 bacterium 4484_211 TaxID=1968527 RepID=A0A1W9NXX4_UNCC3|nr:MAG: hypothetical protein B5M47_02235 [candidate division CPR3 bacterium 4484_211]
MLIEDDKLLNDLQTEMMTESGIRVISLLDPSEQISIMKREKDNLDLVISGILQPEIDGLEMLKRVKGIDEIKHIPWIVSTNLCQESIAEEAYKLGAVDYLPLSKLSADEWLARVLKFLERSQSKT